MVLIKNLNAFTFAEYGELLAPVESRREAAKDVICPISEEDLHVYHLTGEGMRLDFLENMTVLAAGHSRTQLEYFYLDKPVFLRGGVWFALIPLTNTSAVRYRLAGSSAWSEASEFVLNKPISLTRQMNISRIYTLFYQEKEKGFFFKGEHHAAAELTYVDRGELHSVVEGEEELLHQGNMVIYGPEQWHMQYSDLDVSVNFVTISFDIEFAFLDLLTGRKFSLRSEDVDLLHQILEESRHPGLFGDDVILSRLELLLLNVLRLEEPQTDKLRSASSVYNENGIIRRAQSYIADHVCSKLSVGSVAEAVNVSPSYLTALFQQHLHLPPGEYIRRVKLEESKKLIRSGEKNFSQIAQLLGYSSVQHFSRQFKKYFDITPTQYARSIHFQEGA